MSNSIIPRLAVMLAAALTWAGTLQARPVAYVLEPAKSIVGFEIEVGQSPLKGTMPVTRADIVLDFDSAAASRVLVTLAPDQAQMGLPFATQAMRGPDILAADRFPEIRFESTRVRPTDTGAEVEGLLTIRGATKPVVLTALLTRPQGTLPGYRDELTIRLTGAVSRRAFGAGGYADLVGDAVQLRITAHIRLAGTN